MPKKEPLRRCLGCMEMKNKSQLIRVVKNKDGDISLDRTGKALGRGAYLCEDPNCFAAARKAKRFEREFKGSIPDEIYEKVEAELVRYG